MRTIEGTGKGGEGGRLRPHPLPPHPPGSEMARHLLRTGGGTDTGRRSGRRGRGNTGGGIEGGGQGMRKGVRTRRGGREGGEAAMVGAGIVVVVEMSGAAGANGTIVVDQVRTMADEPNSLAAMEAATAALETAEKEKEKPNFEYSGKLADDTNKVRGIVLQFTEPPEARKPTTRWRLYVFKDGEPLKEPLYIHRQSAYLFGRERKVADVPTDHPSCSKQHAVFQYRMIEEEDPNTFTKVQIVKPYIMDLGSTNGTWVNGTRIEAQRYYELLEKDTIKFGNSSREYVLLHEHSA